MNFVMELGEGHCNFLPHDKVGEVAKTVKQFQAAPDGIVVGDGYQIHSAAFGGAIDVDWGIVAIPAAQKLKVLRVPGMSGVAMQVSLEKPSGRSFDHDILY
jgi:hypothetical protein